MKKLLVALMLLCLVFAASALAEDAVSSASVADFYGETALAGDDLMNAINSFSGFYIITTTNPDGTPNSGFFIYGCVKHEDTYYLQFGLAENQTRQNLIDNGEALAVYAALPAADANPYPVAGARMWVQQVTDEDVLAALNENAREGTLFFEIVSLRSLG